MRNLWSRRSLLRLASVTLPFGGIQLRSPLAEKGDSSDRILVTDLFPTQPPELTREIVTVSHFNLKRVRELLRRARPLRERRGIGVSAIGSRHWALPRHMGTERLPSASSRTARAPHCFPPQCLASWRWSKRW